jgi:catechol-2,3-dioxygenase
MSTVFDDYRGGMMKSVVTDGNHRGVPDPAVKAAKIGFVALQSEDVDAMADYYEKVLGFAVTERSAEVAYLTTGSDHHCVVLEKGETKGRTRLGFQIYGELGDAEKGLAAAGIEVERRSDPEPGIAQSLVIEEPGGTPLHLYEEQAQGPDGSVPGVRPTKLGHVASFVPDLGQIQAFYEQALGFRWSDTVADYFIFLRCTPDHHTLNFLTREGREAGLHHIAYEARDVGHLKDILDHLAKHGYRLVWGPGRHGAGHNLFSYHKDPDGNITEVFTELDVIYDEETGHYEPRPWHETQPMGPKVWPLDELPGNIWGIPPMPDAGL